MAPPENNCYLVEWINVYPDNTTDVKYEALKDEANFESMFREEDSLLFIRELNREWIFKLSHDTLFEVNNVDPYCFLVKEKK